MNTTWEDVQAKYKRADERRIKSMKKYQEKRRAKISSKRRLRQGRAVPLPKLKKKLWTLLHDFIVKRDCGICVSCGKPGNQCGHYIKKSICNLMWQYNVLNLGCQCIKCNIFLHGNPVEYRKWMIRKYGEEIVKSIEEHYRDQPAPCFNSRVFIEGEIQKYEKNTQAS